MICAAVTCYVVRRLVYRFVKKVDSGQIGSLTALYQILNVMLSIER
jgi:hypothetical protein